MKQSSINKFFGKPAAPKATAKPLGPTNAAREVSTGAKEVKSSEKEVKPSEKKRGRSGQVRGQHRRTCFG